MSDHLKYVCLKCRNSSFSKYSSFWKCENCNEQYVCYKGMPKLYLEGEIGAKDKSLRDYFYNGLLGKFYQFLMPFMTLPARPFKISKRDWLIYSILVLVNVISILDIIFLFDNSHHFVFFSILSILFLFLEIYFFVKHPYLFYLFLLVIPVKLSLMRNKYKPKEGFKDIHEKVIGEYLLSKNKKLQVLDISTGTGNSLYRHGWMKLDAEYTGLDLSETMLDQCQDFMSVHKVPIDLIVGDATSLPFKDKFFDIVMNYGAINGYSDIKTALKEMVRVTKLNGLILFLDEQLYSQASSIEKIYFDKVLSSHNLIHHCPVELLPKEAGSPEVYQVYEFYYLCMLRPI